MKSQILDSGVANFVQKAFEIISVQHVLIKNNEYYRIIQWSANGKEFTIKDIQEFEQQILPKYFRHRNINSFIRQLNMYGFHKSRKQPLKNIFSHPYFQKDKPQLLCQVKRKIKLQQNQTPRKPIQLSQSEQKISIHDKPTAQKQQPRIASSTSLAFRSSVCLQKQRQRQKQRQKQQQSPVKGLISRSFIMDINPQLCLKLRQNLVLAYDEHQDKDDDGLSIADQIDKERKRFNNRTQGISIVRVRTSNFLDQFQF